MSSRRIRFLIEAVNNTKVPLGEVENGLERLRRARLDANRIVMEQSRAESYLSRVWRNQHRTLYDGVSLMRNVGYVGNTLLNINNSLALSQIRLTEAAGNVADAEARLIDLREKGLEDTVYYKNAVEDLEAAKKAEAEATLAAEKTQKAAILSYIGAAAQVGNLTLKIGELLTKVGLLPTTLGAAATAATALGTAASGALALVGGLIGIELMAPGKTPTPMSGLLPPELGLTKDELESGMDYADKFAIERQKKLDEMYGVGAYTQTPQDIHEWEKREASRDRKRGGDLTIIQTVHGVDAKDAADKAVDKIIKVAADRLVR